MREGSKTKSVYGKTGQKKKSACGDSVNCPVCLDTFTTQKVGTPDTCNHTFCAACLQECAKNNNICPVYGQKYNFILVRRHLGGEIIKRIPVVPPRGDPKVRELGRRERGVQIMERILVEPPRLQIEGDPEIRGLGRRERRSDWMECLLFSIANAVEIVPYFITALVSVLYSLPGYVSTQIFHTIRSYRPTPITVPHSKKAVITFSRDGNLGPQEGTRKTAVKVREP
jgi:hypothetical protein